MSEVPTAIADTPKASLPVCVQCSGALERVRRTSFMQRRILPLLYRYPWRCVLCNDITYRTARHRGELRRQHGVTKDPL